MKRYDIAADAPATREVVSDDGLYVHHSDAVAEIAALKRKAEADIGALCNDIADYQRDLAQARVDVETVSRGRDSWENTAHEAHNLETTCRAARDSYHNDLVCALARVAELTEAIEKHKRERQMDGGEDTRVDKNLWRVLETTNNGGYR